MAAALLVSLCQGHPFLDGNERTATVLAFNFLAANGLTLEMDEGALEKLVMRVAEGHLGKEGSRKLSLRTLPRAESSAPTSHGATAFRGTKSPALP